MAQIATFSADFSQFDAALAQAREKLEGFAVSGRGVAASLERLAKSFSGANIIAEANKVVAAVEAIGGASRLTESEQRKVNATVTEALAKYRALGQEAPEAMRRLAKETTPVSAGLGQIGTIAAGLVSGQAIIGFAEGAVRSLRSLTIGLIEAGDRIDDLAVRTGLSRTVLQQWEFAAQQTNTTLQAVIQGSEALAQRITEGSTEVVRAVQALGLSLADLRQQDPAELMRTVAQALANVESATERTARARELLGRSGGELIPFLANLTQLADEASRVGAVMSDDLVRSSSDLNDAWVSLKAAGKGLLIEVLEPVAPILATIATAFRHAAAASQEFGGFLGLLKTSSLAAIPGVGQFVQGLSSLRDALIALGPLSQQTPPPSPLQAWRREVEGLAIALPDARDKVRQLSQQIDQSTRAARDAEQAAKAWRTALDGLTGRDRLQAAEALLQKLRAIGDPNLISPSRFAEIRDVMSAAQEAAARLGERVNAEWQAWINRVGVLTFKLRNELMPALESVAVVAEALPSRALPGGGMTTLPGSPAGVAVPVGGGLSWFDRIGRILNQGQGILGFLGAFGLGGVGGAAGRVFGGAASGFALGSTIGTGLGAFGLALPALGPFGALAGGILGLASLFGGGEEARVVNPRRDQFLAQFGGPGTGPGSGFHTLASILAEIPESLGGGFGGGQLFRDLINADTEKEYEAAVTRINQVLSERNALLTEQAGLEAQLAALQKSQEPTWEEISRLAEQYGISIDGLGPAIQQLRQQDIASQLLNDIERLVKAGGDMGGILVGMREEFSAFVQDSLKFGTEVPENLRPYIEELARSGQLLDENGQAITDLSQIKWGPPIKTQSEIVAEAMEKIVKRLEEIADLLAGKLPQSAREGTEELDRVIRDYNPPEIVIPTRFGSPDSGDVQGFQSGTGGVRDFGRGTLAILHGREAVLTEGQLHAVQRSRATAIRIEVPVLLDGREVARSTARYSADLLPLYGVV